MKKKKNLQLALASVCAIALVVALTACAPRENNPSSKDAEIMPSLDEFGIVTAEGWSGLYPLQYSSLMENESNSPDSGKHNYLETYPALNTMYKGYGFAKGYDEASSHSYTLHSVINTPRVGDATLANCLTCKTPQFTAMVNSQGEGVYALSFSELASTMTEPISCYNCHGNDPTQLELTHEYFIASMGDDLDNAPIEAQVCGQCHNEYYFETDKSTTNPYTGLAAMTPDAILAYYDAMGFKDWVHPDTGAPMLKVQHPEFEFLYGGSQSQMASMDFACSDCHMETRAAEDGSKYSSHYLTSPLESKALLEKCGVCHDDISAEVAAWQEQVTTREIAISEKIERYTQQLAAKKDSLSADQLAEAQKLQRHAQFYWDYVMVENSEGAHNPTLANETLDKAEACVDAGFALLG